MIPLFGIAKTVRALREMGIKVPTIVRGEGHPAWQALVKLNQDAGNPAPRFKAAHFTPRPDFLQDMPDVLKKPFIALPRRIPDYTLENLQARYGPGLTPETMGAGALTHELGHDFISRLGPQDPYIARAIEGAEAITDSPEVQDAVSATLSSTLGIPSRVHPDWGRFIVHDLKPEEVAADAWSMAGMNAIQDRASGQLPLLPKDEMRRMILEEVLDKRRVRATELDAGYARNFPTWEPPYDKTFDALTQARIPGTVEDPIMNRWRPAPWAAWDRFEQKHTGRARSW